MRPNQLLFILEKAIADEAWQVTCHVERGYSHLLTVHGIDDPLIQAEIVCDDLICAVTKEGKQTFIDPSDVFHVSVTKKDQKPPISTGVYN